MPLARIEIPAGKPASYRIGVSDAVQAALHAALGVPLEEFFHVLTEHSYGNLVIDPNYLGVVRSHDALIVQVFLNGGRDASQKRDFYRTLADILNTQVGLRREDLIVNLVEVTKADWSFGNGEAQLA